MITEQERVVRKIVKKFGMLDKPAFPKFQDFVNTHVPANMLSHMWELGGGKQTAGSTAVLQYLYGIYVVIKAGDAVFEVSPDIIAALRDTSIGGALVGELRPPFEGIIIDVPIGTFAPPGELISRLIVTRVDRDNRFRMVCQNSEEFTSYANFLVDDDSLTIDQALVKTDNFDLGIPEETMQELEKGKLYKDYHSADVFRFAVNLVLYITSDQADVVQDRSKEHAIIGRLDGEKKKAKRSALEQELQREKSSKRFIVGAKYRMQPEYVADFTDAGRAWVLKHRFRVIGHWKSQPHGPKQSLRKRIWVAPYFKGPTMAELVNRGYVVT